MASTFIDTTTAAAVIGTMFDSVTVRELRPNYPFDAVAQEKVWPLSTPPQKGDAISFPNLSALSANTAALDSTNDSVATGAEKLTYTRRTASLSLYGDHASVDVLGLVPEAFADVVSDAAWAIRDQAMNSLNKIARQAMDLNRYSNEASGTISSTYHAYGSSGTASNIGPLKAKDVRIAYEHLKSNNVQTWPDGYFRAIVAPIGIQQIRAESGNAAWRAAAVNDGASGPVANAEIGSFEGFMFIADNTVKGAGTQTITSYWMGREAVGKAVGKDVSVGMNSTMRGVHENLAIIRWNALIGYKVIRRIALYTVEHDNTAK